MDFFQGHSIFDFVEVNLEEPEMASPEVGSPEVKPEDPLLYNEYEYFNKDDFVKELLAKAQENISSETEDEKKQLRLRILEILKSGLSSSKFKKMSSSKMKKEFVIPEYLESYILETCCRLYPEFTKEEIREELRQLMTGNDSSRRSQRIFCPGAIL